MYFIIGGVILFLILKILSVPFKIIFKLIINAIAGAVLLLIVNLLLSNFDLFVPVSYTHLTLPTICSV